MPGHRKVNKKSTCKHKNGRHYACHITTGRAFTLPYGSGYSIPEPKAGLILAFADMGDLSLKPFQTNIFQQGR